MNTLRIFFFVVSASCVLCLNDIPFKNQNEEKLFIRGRVTFSGSSNTRIEPGAKLTVALQDTSLADAPAKTIAKATGTAVQFPMAFAIRYSPSQVKDGLIYSLRVTITNQKDELLYTNDVHVRIKPLGVNRTRFIDVPVISVKSTNSGSNKSEWPELVGMNGVDAVQIIKQQTGFTNVQIIEEGSPVTADYRTDRVRVVVDKNGIVKMVPMIG